MMTLAPFTKAPLLTDADYRLMNPSDVPAQITPQNALLNIIRPQVRERWHALVTRNITPERVEQILRSAFTGNMLAQYELFDLMEDTWPRLKKNLNELKRAVLKVSISTRAFTVGKKASPLAEKKRQLLELALTSCQPSATEDESGFEFALYDLCDAVGKGISVQEILWEFRDTQIGKAILPRAFKWVHPLHYSYRPNALGLKLCPDGLQGTWVDFPENKFLIGNFKTKTGHPLGGAMLRSLAQFWIGANFSYEWALNLAQMFGIPIRWATYDPSQPHLLDDLCDMLENMGSAGWGAFPAGTTLQLQKAVERAADNPAAFIMELADTAADILILGQTLTSSVSKSGGSRALGEVHENIRADIVEYVGSWMASVLKYQFVPALMRLNFGNNNEDPELFAELVEPKDAKSMAERDQILFCTLRLPVSKPWLYERHDVPMPEEGDDIFVAPAAPSPDAGGFGGGGDPTNGGAAAGSRVVLARDSGSSKLADRMMEDLTGVEAKWLGGVKPFFKQLLDMAANENVTDEELMRTIESAAKMMPELFGKLNTGELQTALENVMSAGMANGAARGVMQRGAAALKRAKEGAE